MSKMIYEAAEKIHEKIHFEVGNIFLFLNIVFWCVIAFVLALLGCYIRFGTLKDCGIILFCIIGYTGMIFGFFGGAFYLYRNE